MVSGVGATAIGIENVFFPGATAFKPDSLGNDDLESALQQKEQITPKTIPSPGDSSIYHNTGAVSAGQRITLDLLLQNRIGTKADVFANYLVPLITYSVLIEQVSRHI